LALTLYLPLAEETLVNQPVEIFSPEHASPQAEISATP
jgi:hypothetical protein